MATSLISLPKMGDYGDMMKRMATKNKVAIVNESQTPSDVAKRLNCPNATLRMPSIPAPAAPEVRLMVEGAKELSSKIAIQTRAAEKFAQAAQKNRTLQLEAPRNAMEEYFVSMLAGLRKKEIIEANNAYLTPRQKEMLVEDDLRVKASMPGGLVRMADEMAQEEIAEEADEAERDAEAAARDTAAASAVGTTDPSMVGTSRGQPSSDDIDRVVDSLDDLLTNAAEQYAKMRSESAGREFSLPKAERSKIIQAVRKTLETLEHKGLTSTRINAYYNRVNKLLSGGTQAFRDRMAVGLGNVLANLRSELTALMKPVERDIVSAARAASAGYSKSTTE